MKVDRLIRELIATGTMNKDTLARLKEMQAEFKAGQLHPDDAAYIAALHAKATGAPMPPPPKDEVVEDEPLDEQPHEPVDEELNEPLDEEPLDQEAVEEPEEQVRLEGLSIEEWRERALKAEAALTELRDQAAAEASRPA